MRTKKILYFFNRKSEHFIKEILSGEQPSDRLYGLIELRKLGWHVDFCDERLTCFEKKCRPFFHWINPKSLLKAAKYDVWIVKDDFSLILTISALLMRKRLIYIDSLFHIPKNTIRKFILFINTKLAPKIILYSKYQVDLWSSLFNLNTDKFVVVPYTIDSNFYTKGLQNTKVLKNQVDPYILATGRDLGRDFTTLVKAANKANIGVKLITLSYLKPKGKENYRYEIYENISYTELFQLYQNATIVAVPLKKGIDYPSGIRAVLEALVVRKPVICTVTPILKEYIPESSFALAYVNAEDEDGLTQCILRIVQNNDLQKQLADNGEALVKHSFNMEVFAMALDKLLTQEK